MDDKMKKMMEDMKPVIEQNVPEDLEEKLEEVINDMDGAIYGNNSNDQS